MTDKIKHLFPEDIEDMTEEERAEYEKELEKMLSDSNRLMGLVMAPQTAYGPPNTMNLGSGMGMGMMTPPSPQITSDPEWLDDTHWRCSCGYVCESKFCPECGMSAPDRPDPNSASQLK